VALLVLHDGRVALLLDRGGMPQITSATAAAT
jgi:hypothetical protein